MTDKKDAYYFNHYANARNDRKVRKLRLQLGIEGYGIYFGILENLREQKNFKYPISDLDVLAADLDTSMQKIGVVVKSYGLFEIDESEEFFSPAQLLALQKWVDIKEMNSLKGIKSGLAKRKKLQDQINELKAIEKLSQGDSYKPKSNSGSTAVVLREYSTVQDSTEEVTEDSTLNTNSKDLLEEWLNDYCSYGRKPTALKITMRKLVNSNDLEALEAFETWKDKKMQSHIKYQAKEKIEQFNYSLLVGMVIGDKKILRVSTDRGSSTVHINYSNGTDDPTIPKIDIYEWYHSNKEKR